MARWDSVLLLGELGLIRDAILLAKERWQSAEIEWTPPARGAVAGEVRVDAVSIWRDAVFALSARSPEIRLRFDTEAESIDNTRFRSEGCPSG
jgi:hypothetical protein